MAYRIAEVDGEQVSGDDYDFERVRVAFPYAENGEADPGPVDWCNSAAIVIDEEHDAITLTVSVDDPRGGFGVTVRRLGDGTLLMHVPSPGDSMLHAELTELAPGTFRIGTKGAYGSAAREDDE